MVECYLFSTPRKNQRTIFEKKLWGIEDKYENIWIKLTKGVYALFLERRGDEYWIIGGGVVGRIYRNEKPNPDWGERGNKSNYPLRIEFERVFEIEQVSASKYFNIRPPFTIQKEKLPLELEKYFINKDKVVFGLLTKISEAIAFRELDVSSEVVELVPPLLLKPILSKVSSEEFEDICCIALRLLGFKVEQLGYKRRYDDVWDLEIKGVNRPVIVDVKNSKSYSLTKDEMRKLKDYVDKKYKEENKPPAMFLIALGFDYKNIDKLKKLKEELEDIEGKASLYIVKYTDILKLISEYAKCNKIDPYYKLTRLSI